MERVRKFSNNTTEAIVDAEMELEKEFEEEEKNKEDIEEFPAEVETPVPETANGIVINALNVNVRRWPDKDSEIVETLPKGSRVSIHGKRGDFYEISTNVNHRVYISSKYLKEE